jgi:hypothetical protein
MFFHTEFKTQATWVITKKKYNVHCCGLTFIFSTRLFSVELAWARKYEVIISFYTNLWDLCVRVFLIPVEQIYQHEYVQF